LASIEIKTERVENQGSQPNFTRPQLVGIVGISLGSNTPVSDVPTNLTVADGTSDTLTGYTVRSLDKVALSANDTVNIFTKDVDYTLVAPNVIKWLNTPMTAPELEGSVVSTGGTGLGTTSVNYKITVLDQNSEESLGSNLVTLSGAGATASHKLDWVKVPFATGYKIYDTTAGGLITTITNPNTVSYTRVDNTFSAGTVPASNKARRVPKTGTGTDSTYYASFVSVTYDYDVNSFTSVNQVEQAHGTGSDLTNTAMIGFQDMKVSEMYICAVDGTTNSAFQNAIDKFANLEDIQYIVALKDSTTVQLYTANHAKTYSNDANKKERFAVVNISNGVTSVGTPSTPDTIRYWLAYFGNDKRTIVPVPNGNKIYRNIWQETDGSVTDNKLVPNHFLSAGIAFRATMVPKVSESIAYQFVDGFNFGATGAPWNDSVEQEKITSEGGMYIISSTGRPRVYNDNTNDPSTTENFQRSVLTAEDELRRRLRASVEPYIGNIITDGLVGAIWRKTRDVLQLMVQEGLIKSFNENEIVVEQDALVKTQVNISFAYGALYPLLRVIFKYSFNL
jgi:hypothetical protein